MVQQELPPLPAVTADRYAREYAAPTIAGIAEGGNADIYGIAEGVKPAKKRASRAKGATAGGSREWYSASGYSKEAWAAFVSEHGRPPTKSDKEARNKLGNKDPLKQGSSGGDVAAMDQDDAGFPDEKEKARICSGCGGSGHRADNKACPNYSGSLYAERNAARTNSDGSVKVMDSASPVEAAAAPVPAAAAAVYIDSSDRPAKPTPSGGCAACGGARSLSLFLTVRKPMLLNPAADPLYKGRTGRTPAARRRCASR